MCIALPHRVLRVDGDVALVEHEAARCEVSLLLLVDEVAVGDYLLLHTGGFAVARLDAQTAQQRLREARELLTAGGAAAFARLGRN
jgi:hydrogenase expression/formation protein HypC